MKKRKAIQSGIEQMDAEQRRIQADIEREQLAKSKDMARPTLLKRIGAGLLDFVFAALLAAGLFTIAYFAVFPSLGYQSAAETIINAYEESGLYELGDGNYAQLTYDESKTPEENYDVPLTYFYRTNTRAIQENKIEEYNNSKLDSGYYELNAENQFVRKEGVEPSEVKVFLYSEYQKAIDYLFSDPELVKAHNVAYQIMWYSLLIVIVLSSSIFYIAVPLIDKKHRSIAYMVFKIIPADSTNLGPVKWTNIVLRSFIFIVITYVSPLTLYFWLGGFTFAFIPLFLNILLMSFTRTNSAIHDFGSRINVINESHSNAFETLKAITNPGGEQ